MKFWKGIVSGCVTLLMASAVSAATPNWTEDFSSLTTGTSYGFGVWPPTTVAAVTDKAADMVDDWLVGPRAASSFVTVDTCPITSTAVPAGTKTLLINSTSTTANDDVAVISPVSTGATGKVKYEWYICYPQAVSATALPGNCVFGMGFADSSGNRIYSGTGANIQEPFQIQVGKDNAAANHTWRLVVAGATVAASQTAPSIAWDQFGAQWIKVGMEVDPATKTVKGYLNDTLNWTYDFTSSDTSTWDFSKSYFMVRAYPAMTQPVYLTKVSYTATAGSSVQDWSNR